MVCGLGRLYLHWASGHDARYTRTSVASVRYSCRSISMWLLVGGRLQCGLADECQKYWGVSISDGSTGDYGWVCKI